MVFTAAQSLVVQGGFLNFNKIVFIVEFKLRICNYSIARKGMELIKVKEFEELFLLNYGQLS